MNKHHILIIDDEPDIRELLEITISRMGIATTCAHDMSSALAALEIAPTFERAQTILLESLVR